MRECLERKFVPNKQITNFLRAIVALGQIFSTNGRVGTSAYRFKLKF